MSLFLTPPQHLWSLLKASKLGLYGVHGIPFPNMEPRQPLVLPETGAKGLDINMAKYREVERVSACIFRPRTQLRVLGPSLTEPFSIALPEALLPRQAAPPFQMQLYPEDSTSDKDKPCHSGTRDRDFLSFLFPKSVASCSA